MTATAAHPLMQISRLTIDDLRPVDALMKRNSSTLGFLPRKALCEYLRAGGAFGARTDNDQLVGYVLFAAYPDYFRIAQLCVADEYRRKSIAGRLVNKLVKSATTQKVMRLHCRRDFEAHKIWPRLGFVPLDEKPGRSAAGTILTFFCRALAKDSQLEIFQARTSNDSLDIVIDAQVFFEFLEPESEKTEPSKALLSDFLIDAINLWVTEELFVEIDRQQDQVVRTKSRQRAHEFPKIEYDPQLFEHFNHILREILPSNTRSQVSDIRHLARTASSDVSVFVTKDRNLLRNAAKIAEQTKLRVLSPVDLVIQLHELSEKHSYRPNRISGSNLEWSRLTSSDLASFRFTLFLNHGEKLGHFRTQLESFLAHPDHYECELLRSHDEIFALRILAESSSGVLSSPFGRVANSANQALFGCFMVADTIQKAVQKNVSMVRFGTAYLASPLVSDLMRMGFMASGDGFVRFCFPRSLTRTELTSQISNMDSRCLAELEDKSDLELERHCSPVSLAESQDYFLIPIRPAYAISLFDRDGAASDLFGGRISTLLRWDNVYYRSKAQHKMLRPPARVLWYVSGSQSGVVAVSHLDDVEIGTPKDLFRKFRKFGVLEWGDLWEMCGGDSSREIMALRFSHTFPFTNAVPLSALKVLFSEDQVGLALQGPSRMPRNTFQKILQFGYGSKQ